MRVLSDRLWLHLPQSHPLLRNVARETLSIGARVLAYVGVLGALGILAAWAWDELPQDTAMPVAPKTQWITATRPVPAFALSQFDFGGRVESYEILRHPDGGRKDIMRWSAPAEAAAVEIEIYRPGDEAGQDGPPIAAVAARMDPEGARGVEAAGRIDSKFGPIGLMALSGADDKARACTGFLMVIANSNVHLSGFSCLGDTAPAQRASIGCMLDRLMLLSAGSDPKLAELFARAELKRGTCAPAKARSWMAGVDNPTLRGSF